MPSKLEDFIPAELRPHLIGLWRFRCAVGEPTWCTTFMYRGKFYDTDGAATIELAIKRAMRTLRLIKRRR